MEKEVTGKRSVMAFRIQKEIPELEEYQSSREYALYGKDNRFPEYLFGLYSRSSRLQSIVQSIKVYTCAAMSTPYSHETSNGDTLQDIAKQLISDYCIYGGFSFIVNLINGQKTVEYLSFRNVRTDREHKIFYYSPEWKKRSGVILTDKEGNALPAYDPTKTQEHSVYYYTGHNNPANKAYPLPIYNGSLQDIETSVEVSNFHLSAILNNFNASAIVNFNNGIPSEDDQKEIERRLREKFTGSQAAAKMLVTFNDSRENAVSIERLSEDGFDTKYNALKESVHESIYTAFRFNPILAGQNVQTGFSKQEFKDAYDLFYITVVLDLQQMLARVFKRVGIETTFEKLSIYDDAETTGNETTLTEKNNQQ